MLPILAFILLSALTVRRYGRAKQVLKAWAAGSGYSLVDAQPAIFNRGPWSWTLLDFSVVLWIVVEDAAGHQRAGWFRCVVSVLDELRSLLPAQTNQARHEIRWRDGSEVVR